MTGVERRARAWPLLAASAPLAGCRGVQSVLEPHGANAAEVAALGWTMFWGAAAIFALVLGLAAYAAFGRRRARLASPRLVVALGIVFPVAVLSILLVFGLPASDALREDGPRGTLRIEVTGEQWWWRVHYLDEAGRATLVTANEIAIPAGRRVEFLLRTTDVIHSFWVPNLAGKRDMIPGRVTRLALQADRPGVFRGQCAEYCGGAHALMSFYVVALAPAQFDAWIAAQRAPARAPHDPLHARGRELFLANGCGGCHAIRGTPAAGTIGPDLTHLGSRRSIAAGSFPNHAGALAAWIAGNQQLKPDNRMPPFAIFTADELQALAAYLESLA